LSVLHELGHAYLDGALTEDERWELENEEGLVEGFARQADSGEFEKALQSLEEEADRVIDEEGGV